MNGRNRTRVTLKDIAQESGYTVNTVSHALRGKSDIAPATRRKIVDLAKEMGYVGNALASSLRSGRSNTIAILVSDVINPHFSFVVHNVEACVRKAGYSTIILCTGDRPERESEAVRTALSHRVDGVLICPSQFSWEPIGLLRQCGIPYVIMGRMFDDVEDEYVLCNDEAGARLLTQYLILSGHRRILYIGGDEQFSSQQERLRGYRQATEAAGLREAQAVIGYEEYLWREAEGTLPELIALTQATAVVAFRDAMAWTLINQLRRAGLHVPRDVSVAGFDFIAEHLSFLPPLTTVAAQGECYSTVAARRLIDLMKRGSRPPETVRLAMRIVDPEATVRPLVEAERKLQDQ